MKRWEIIVQTTGFSVGVFTLLLLLSVAVRLPLGRVSFAILISGICLIAELFALYKALQLMWRVSDKLAKSILRIAHPGAPSPTLLTENKN